MTDIEQFATAVSQKLDQAKDQAHAQQMPFPITIAINDASGRTVFQMQLNKDDLRRGIILPDNVNGHLPVTATVTDAQGKATQVETQRPRRALVDA